MKKHLNMILKLIMLHPVIVFKLHLNCLFMHWTCQTGNVLCPPSECAEPAL